LFNVKVTNFPLFVKKTLSPSGDKLIWEIGRTEAVEPPEKKR